MNDLTHAEYQAISRQDLYTYTMRCFAELHSRGQFKPNWHMEVIAAKLQECMRAVVSG